MLKIMVLHWKGEDSNSWFWYQVPKRTFYELHRFKDTVLFGLGLYFLKYMNTHWFLLPLYDVWHCILNSNKEVYIWFGCDIRASFNLYWRGMMREPKNPRGFPSYQVVLDCSLIKDHILNCGLIKIRYITT